MNLSDGPDYQRIFEGSPGAYLILSPGFTIQAVSDAYLAATMTQRAQIVGLGLFEVFPDNPNDPKADGVKNLTYSLRQVLRTKRAHTMAIQKYDIPRPETPGHASGWDVRYWRPTNTPVLSADDSVLYITHAVEDVTHMVETLSDAMDQQGSLKRA